VPDLTARHVTNPYIAVRLGISGKTVRNHISTIFARLEGNGGSRAIVLARQASGASDGAMQHRTRRHGIV
jgi:DNA-binding CsgD family transcriptional regulator